MKEKNKMPLIVFGDGMKNKEAVKFKGHMVGVTGVIYRQLQIRERRGELLLLDINEYNTSKVRNQLHKFKEK